MHLNEIVEQSYELAKEKGWWDDPEFNIGEKLALIHSEVSEALEELRNGYEPTEIYYHYCVVCNGTGILDDIPCKCIPCKGMGRNEKPEGFPIELIDVIIRIADLAGKLGIDLEHAYERKYAYNKTRPHRHGGKRF